KVASPTGGKRGRFPLVRGGSRLNTRQGLGRAVTEVGMVVPGSFFPSKAEDRGLRSWPVAVANWFFGPRPDPGQPAGRQAPAVRFRNLCISREAGAGGGAIARIVGARLNWKVYNRELIEAIAHRMELPIEEVQTLDELAPSV